MSEKSRVLSLTLVLMAIMLLLMPGGAGAAEDNEEAPIRVGMLSLLKMNEQELEQWYKANSPEPLILEGKIEITGASPEILEKVKASSGKRREYLFYDSLNTMWLALQAGEIDEIMINQKTGEYLASTDPDILVIGGLTAKEESPETDMVIKSTRDSFSFLVLKENLSLRNEVDDALRAMKEDGTIDRLVREQIDAAIAGEEIKPVELKQTAGADTIRVAVTGDLPPMDYMTAEGTPAGFNTAILAEIGSRLEKNIVLVNIDSGARALALSGREADMVFWMRGTEEQIPPEETGTGSGAEESEPPKDRPELPPGDMPGDLDLFKEKDYPEGTLCTIPYFTDNLVRVIRNR